MNTRGFGNTANGMGWLILSILIAGTALAMVVSGCSSESGTVEVIKEVPVEKVVTREVVKEVQVPGETIVIEKEVVKEVQVPGETIVVEKEVVKEVQVPGETIVVEKEVVKEVPVEKVVVREVVKSVQAAPTPAAQAMPAPTAAPAVAMQSAPAATAVPAPAPQAPQQAGAYSQYGSRQARAGATTFKDYRQSLFVETTRDSISTFSLDTDRTSYHLALNWARSGYEVDPDSVRAEEWINAFNYGYEPPKHSDSFAVTADVFEHPIDGGLYLARLGFQAPHLQDNRPLNVTLVLDASGSMSDGNRVAIAREAAESIRRSLGRQDRIGVVHFTTDVIDQYTVEHQNPDDRDVKMSISQLAPHGSTNVQAGLDLGVRMADSIRQERPDAYNYIILMSDGVANVDATDPFAILESAYDRNSGNPLRLITIGVGIENYNDFLLEQLAQYGNGWYRYLSTEDQARETFSRDNWLALSAPFADQTRAQVTWDPEVVKSWRMIGYENRVTSDESFTEDRKEFAEIPVGAATTVFYELELTDRARRSGPVMQLGDVELRWVTPLSGQSNRQDTTIVAGLTPPGIDTVDQALLQFGAVVALSSDRYSSLTHIDDHNATEVQRDMTDLLEELWTLGDHLGGLDSYNDFAFVLEHITEALPETIRASGYSR